MLLGVTHITNRGTTPDNLRNVNGCRLAAKYVGPHGHPDSGAFTQGHRTHDRAANEQQLRLVVVVVDLQGH